MGIIGKQRTGAPAKRPRDARSAERRQMGAALAGGLAALALTLLMAPAAPSFAEDAAAPSAPASATPDAGPAADQRATAPAPAATARVTPDASAPSGATSSQPQAGPAAAPAAPQPAASRPPALTVPEPVPAALAPTPAPHPGSAPERPSADGVATADGASPAPADPADGAAPAPADPADGADPEPAQPERFVTILYRTSPGTAGNVNPSEEQVRADDGAGLSGSTALPLRGYVSIGWYNGANQVSADALLTRDEALAGANRNADGTLADTTFIARFARPSASLQLAEELVSSPANGRFFTEGEPVTFRATVTNTGNVTLSGVTFASDEAAFASVGPLAPGQSRTSEWTHVVTAADVQRDALVSTVSAHGEAPEYGLSTEAGPESATAQTGTLAAGDTYVLYGAYPADAGQVSRSVCIVESRTGAGLDAVIAEPRPGYVFEGWYEDDERVSTEATLAPETALAFLNRGRAAYSPTLFLAYFVPEEPQPVVPDEPDTPVVPDKPEEPTTPDNPDTPDAPNTPDDPAHPDVPATPDDPDEPSVPAAPDTPDAPAAPDADDAPAPAPSPDASAAPTGPDARKATPSNGAPSIPQTGDSAPALATLLLAAVAVSAFALHRARRHLGDPR